MRDQITNNYYYSTSAPREKPSDIAVPNPSNNPFTSRLRINDPDMFFGRKQIIRELQQSLVHGNSIALIGPSGVGKSSLLYYLYMTRAEWLHNSEAIYLDLQGVFGEQDLYNEIHKLLTPLDKRKPQSDENPLQMIRDALRMKNDILRMKNQTPQDPTILLMLDEVDRLTQRDFKVELQGLLRSLTQENTLSLLVACKYEIKRVFTAIDPDSPFHNVFKPTLLDNFSRLETDAFIRESLKSTNINFTAPEVDKLWQATQGHPAQVKRLAEELFDLKVKNR